MPQGKPGGCATALQKAHLSSHHIWDQTLAQYHSLRTPANTSLAFSPPVLPTSHCTSATQALGCSVSTPPHLYLRTFALAVPANRKPFPMFAKLPPSFDTKSPLKGATPDHPTRIGSQSLWPSWPLLVNLIISFHTLSSFS